MDAANCQYSQRGKDGEEPWESGLYWILIILDKVREPQKSRRDRKPQTWQQMSQKSDPPPARQSHNLPTENTLGNWPWWLMYITLAYESLGLADCCELMARLGYTSSSRPQFWLHRQSQTTVLATPAGLLQRPPYLKQTDKENKRHKKMKRIDKQKNE